MQELRDMLDDFEAAVEAANRATTDAEAEAFGRLADHLEREYRDRVSTAWDFADGA